MGKNKNLLIAFAALVASLSILPVISRPYVERAKKQLKEAVVSSQNTEPANALERGVKSLSMEEKVRTINLFYRLSEKEDDQKYFENMLESDVENECKDIIGGSKKYHNLCEAIWNYTKKKRVQNEDYSPRDAIEEISGYVDRENKSRGR